MAAPGISTTIITTTVQAKAEKIHSTTAYTGHSGISGSTQDMMDLPWISTPYSNAMLKIASE
eukprot:m.7614 g.7614  ORF g.7614 m.7614 type:complete len:62 (+) comp5258_c0_seq1:812-997(+)